MLRTLAVVVCALGVVRAATFISLPKEEDLAHPRQCYDEVLKSWHMFGESWNQGGECFRSTCNFLVGYRDEQGTVRKLSEIQPGVYGRSQHDPDRISSSSGSPGVKNLTVTFEAGGKTLQWLHSEGEKLIKPQGFLTVDGATCSYFSQIPANCKEKNPGNHLPYPDCCPVVNCDGDPAGMIVALG